MARLEVLGGFAGNLGLAETLFGKHDRERVQIALRTAGKGHQRRGIESARKEDAERNVGNQVIANGFFEQWPQLLCRIRQTFWLRPIRLERGVGKIPVGLRLRLRRRSVRRNREGMTGRKRKHAFDQSGRFGDRTEQKIGFERIRRHARRDASAGDQRPDFGGKQKRSIRVRVIQRLDPQPVARKENARASRRVSRCAGGTSIPYGEGKHAAEFAHALFAPFFVGVDDDFGVRVRAKRVPASFERLAQLPEVVDFTVEDNSDIACFVEYGLVSAGKVNDAEAAHSQRRGWSDEEPVFVRAAMPKRLHHPARNGFA